MLITAVSTAAPTTRLSHKERETRLQLTFHKLLPLAMGARGKGAVISSM